MTVINVINVNVNVKVNVIEINVINANVNVKVNVIACSVSLCVYRRKVTIHVDVKSLTQRKPPIPKPTVVTALRDWGQGFKCRTRVCV